MSVVSCTLKSVSGGITEDGERRYQKIYQVITDTPNDGPIVAQLASGVERYSQSYAWGNEADTGAWVVDVQATHAAVEQSRVDWRVTVSFSSRLEPPDRSHTEVGEPIDDPLARRPIWSGSFVEYQKTLEKHIDGKPIINMAGDLIEGLTTEDSRPTLRCTRNVADIDLNKWASYRDCVNSDSWMGLPPRAAKCRNISWAPARWGPYRYYEVNYEFEIKLDPDFPNLGGWRRQIENRGFRARPSIGADAAKIPDIVEPVFLDEWGRRLSQADIDANNFYTLTVFAELEKPFAALNLGTQITG